MMKRLPEVKSQLGHRADASVYNAVRSGLLTPGISIGARAKAWPDYEIRALIEARVAGFTHSALKKLVSDLIQARPRVAGLNDDELRQMVSGLMESPEVAA